MAQDALYAQLLEMGFESDQIEECQIALIQSSSQFNLQAATEWLLQRGPTGMPAPAPAPPTSSASGGSLTLDLTTTSQSDTQRPVSSTQLLSSPVQPVHSSARRKSSLGRTASSAETVELCVTPSAGPRPPSPAYPLYQHQRR